MKGSRRTAGGALPSIPFSFSLATIPGSPPSLATCQRPSTSPPEHAMSRTRGLSPSSPRCGEQSLPHLSTETETRSKPGRKAYTPPTQCGGVAKRHLFQAHAQLTHTFHQRKGTDSHCVLRNVRSKFIIYIHKTTGSLRLPQFRKRWPARGHSDSELEHC